MSFHRYLKETIKMAELAKKQGAIVIGITDSSVAPITQYSDTILTISQPAKSTLDATPTLFSLLNAIVANVSVQDKERFEKNRNMNH
ncbi:MurR/RpiR family transcriptional regulator [Bacillota bacterium Lsc_1132]